MKNMYNLIITNIIILICLFLIYIRHAYFTYSYIILILALIYNIFIIYKKSNSFDRKEEKKKLMLHKIKNSLSVILGYNEAFNDRIITKKELDEKLNSEIEIIINIIKDEIYKK